MDRIQVVVDGARPLKDTRDAAPRVDLFTRGTARNVRCETSQLSQRLLAGIDDRSDDLLRIAAVAYSADTRVGRGSATDVFARSWSRWFRIVMPVRDRAFWEDSGARETLARTLGFLTDDVWEFHFRSQRQRDEREGFLFSDAEPAVPAGTNLVVLFSGGTDSLATVVEAIAQRNTPVLVSHRSAPTIQARQNNLVQALRERFGSSALSHVSVLVNRQGGRRALEFSQRSRAFLFASVGGATAAVLGVNEVWVSDNGVVSVNLQRSGQTIGALASRSTHPKFLRLVTSLLRDVYPHRNISVTNTLLLRTKADVLKAIASSGHGELLEEAVSCAHHEGRPRLKPHCAVCSQCIDRRFAAVAADVENLDPVARYEKDIFTDDLLPGAERTLFENHVRFALELESCETPESFHSRFPEVDDCFPPDGTCERMFSELYSMFRRHAQAVNAAIEQKLREYGGALRRGRLAGNCGLLMIAGGRHTEDQRERYARSLGRLIGRGLPVAFQAAPPPNEGRVQDAGEALITAAAESLAREGPQLPFAGVSTKPDFSRALPKGDLFIEFKYPKDRSRLNAVITEMTSRVTIYRDQGAAVLFVVYDPARTIHDDEGFVAQFERHEAVWVVISR